MQFVPPGFMNLLYPTRHAPRAFIFFVIEGIPQVNQRIVGLYPTTNTNEWFFF